jgi:parallel beta-helix repeat protein
VSIIIGQIDVSDMIESPGSRNQGGRGFEGRCLHRKKRRRVDRSYGHSTTTFNGSSPMAKLATDLPCGRPSTSIHSLLNPFRRLSLFHSLYLFAILLLSLPSTHAAATTCLRFADYDSINALLTDGGPGTVIQLCPSKIYRLSGPIIFTAAEQEITTFGQPTDNTRAVLRVQGNGETAVQGDCRRCKGVKIRNLIIDGYRPKLGRSKPTELAGPLVVLGGNEGQVVQDCILRNPRGFTAIHVREGDKLECKGASIIGNTIGPVGEEYDPKKDGEDPELSPLGKPLADGLSVACRDSHVKDNIFFDNTAASIVLYCSPGTIVENNTITSDKASAMAGILMVDATPFEADYTGVIVQGNTISARGAGMRVGIGIGPTVWSDDTETILTGGSVIQNKLEGAHMGYGIAAAGLKGWTILDNVNEASYEGQRGDRCFPEMTNPDPMPFLFTSGTITESQVQEEFVNADFQYGTCPSPHNGTMLIL